MPRPSDAESVDDPGQIDRVDRVDQVNRVNQVDHVDRVVAMWNEQRPDLDVSGMAIIGRLARLNTVIRAQLDTVFAKHGLESWEFDVLATLRRSGPPYRLSAGALLESMMITSGTMTNRIDKLEGRKLIARTKDQSDKRVVLVSLTESGFATIEAAVTDHAGNESRILAALDAGQQRTLVDLLRTLQAGQRPSDG